MDRYSIATNNPTPVHDPEILLPFPHIIIDELTPGQIPSYEIPDNCSGAFTFSLTYRKWYPIQPVQGFISNRVIINPDENFLSFGGTKAFLNIFENVPKGDEIIACYYKDKVAASGMGFIIGKFRFGDTFYPSHLYGRTIETMPLKRFIEVFSPFWGPSDHRACSRCGRILTCTFRKSAFSNAITTSQCLVCGRTNYIIQSAAC